MFKIQSKKFQALRRRILRKILAIEFTPSEACHEANQFGYSKYLEDIAAQEPSAAFNFALYIPGANIKRLQEVVVQCPMNSYFFAKNVAGADIQKCSKGSSKNLYWAFLFLTDIPGANTSELEQVIFKNPMILYN